MESKFDEYVSEWWHQYLEEHEDDGDTLLQLGNVLTDGDLTEDSLSEYLEEDQTLYDFLYDMGADEVYEKLFSYSSSHKISDIPSSDDFALSILQQSVKEIGFDQYDFVNEFIEDMAIHITGYQEFIGFFQDLQHGGCVSGMIGMLIYHRDCLELYGKYAVSMEDFKEELEEQTGEPIRQGNDRTYHYTWMCWFCYEELAFEIARHLYEDEF